MAIYSEVDVGTTVRLYFPATQEIARAEGSLGTHQADRGGPERILVVDDRIEVAELAREMLEELGYSVELRTDPQEALKLLDSQPPGFCCIKEWLRGAWRYL